MSTYRIALANLPYPATPDESVALAVEAIARAGAEQAGVICFSECYVPGYRTPSHSVPPPDRGFLARAWKSVAAAAARADITVALGTERFVNDSVRITMLVVNRDGSIAGVQDKVQLDPSEESLFVAGEERRVFQAGALTFGFAICHEGWRYPETARWAARRGAQVVFIPHFHEAEPGGFQPTTFADPANTFHEKAMLCRAAENTVWVAAVNVASEGSPTTSAFVRPDGTLHSHQPYGKAGLLIADLDLGLATGLLASRCRAY